MKKLLLFIAILFILQSCNEKKEFCIINTTTSDTIRIKSQKKDVVVLTNYQVDKINELRPIIRDIAYYFIINKNKQTRDDYEFKCGEFAFWKCNGIHHFELTKPKKIDLTSVERKYFYDMYQEYKKNQPIPQLKMKRLYEWENNVDVVIKN